MAAAATLDSTVCSGNIRGAPRCPMEKSVRIGVCPAQASSSVLSSLSSIWLISQAGRGP